MDIKAYRYDAGGAEEEVQPKDVDIRKSKETTNVLERDIRFKRWI